MTTRAKFRNRKLQRVKVALVNLKKRSNNTELPEAARAAALAEYERITTKYGVALVSN